MSLTGGGKVKTSRCYWTTLILESPIAEGRGTTVGRRGPSTPEAKSWLSRNVKGQLTRDGTGRPKSRVRPRPRSSSTPGKGKLLSISGGWWPRENARVWGTTTGDQLLTLLAISHKAWVSGGRRSTSDSMSEHQRAWSFTPGPKQNPSPCPGCCSLRACSMWT